MTLNEYLKQNTNSSVETMELLFSVGCVIDTVSGNTFPMMADSSIGFDEPTNVMDMDFNDDSYEWYNSLDVVDKQIVDNVCGKFMSNEEAEWLIGKVETHYGIQKFYNEKKNKIILVSCCRIFNYGLDIFCILTTYGNG